MIPARVVFHLDPKYFDRFHEAKHLALYPRIAEIIARRGGEISLARRPAGPLTPKAAKGDGDLHIVESGASRGVGYLNAALCYLPGFWHLDPKGVLADSSISAQDYDPAGVDPAAAAAFYADLQTRFAEARQSRYRQAKARADLPAGAVVVFLQGPLPQRRDQAHMSYADMLRAAALAANGRPVLAKPHPLKVEMGLQTIADIRAEGFDILTSDANVHDLLAAAAVTVSVNSAASLEGFLHGKPAILCGRADFANMAETVTAPADFPAAMARALATPRDYAPWFQWYFAERCLALEAPDFEQRLLAIFKTAGFDAEKLGLR